MLVKSIGISQRLGLMGLGRAAGITHLLPGDMPRAERMIGPVPAKSARRQLPAVSPAIGPTKHRVVYFLGCGTDLLYPEVAMATVKVLTNLGCEVDIVDGLKCCGLPHLGSGEESSARELAVFNSGLIKYRSPDVIISDCASCSSTLKGHIYGGLFPAGYDDRIMDAQVFISGLADCFFPKKEVALLTVTYHDSCHLSKALKITAQPRELLKKIPGVTYVEMKDADKCCGGSGTYPMTNFDMSMKILGRKLANISNTGADVVAAACPGCITQLSFGARDKKMAVKVKHPLEILADIF
jgi:glycolate oxidase iron-sulfur subunit